MSPPAPSTTSGRSHAGGTSFAMSMAMPARRAASCGAIGLRQDIGLGQDAVLPDAGEPAAPLSESVSGSVPGLDRLPVIGIEMGQQPSRDHRLADIGIGACDEKSLAKRLIQGRAAGSSLDPIAQGQGGVIGPCFGVYCCSPRSSPYLVRFRRRRGQDAAHGL